jgi:hypothetical protein
VGRVLLFISLVIPLLEAQNARPVITLMPIEGIDAEEGRLVESLIRSYLSEYGDVRAPGENTFTAETLDSRRNYTITANVTTEGENRVLVIFIDAGAPETANTYTHPYRSTGELALELRSLLETAFTPVREDGEVRAEPLSEIRILGSWRGEPGISMIRLYRGGQGTVIFSSGARMTLYYSIADNVLTLRQVSPNADRYYYPLPYEQARILSEEAEPMVWELRLYGGGSVLRGLKYITVYRAGENRAVPETREVEWIRGPR